jgi:hypothetical protein
MANSGLRRLLKQLVFPRPADRPGGRPRAAEAKKRRARPLFVEWLEDRTLLDATLQAITLASVAPPSTSAAAGSSAYVTVSADGRYVAYESTAPNLVAGQSGGAITRNVFLLDRQTGTAALVSHDAANATLGGNADSFSAVLSANGHDLYYLSRATDLVSGGTGPATENLYVYDTVAGTTRLVTANFAAPGQRADQDTGLIDPTRATGAPFAVSADGTRVAYVSTADDLVSGLTGSVGAGHANVFLAAVSATAIITQLVSGPAPAGSPSVRGRRGAALRGRRGRRGGRREENGGYCGAEYRARQATSPAHSRRRTASDAALPGPARAASCRYALRRSHEWRPGMPERRPAGPRPARERRLKAPSSSPDGSRSCRPGSSAPLRSGGPSARSTPDS